MGRKLVYIYSVHSKQAAFFLRFPPGKGKARVSLSIGCFPGRKDSEAALDLADGVSLQLHSPILRTQTPGHRYPLLSFATLDRRLVVLMQACAHCWGTRATLAHTNHYLYESILPSFSWDACFGLERPTCGRLWLGTNRELTTFFHVETKQNIKSMMFPARGQLERVAILFGTPLPGSECHLQSHRSRSIAPAHAQVKLCTNNAWPPRSIWKSEGLPQPRTTYSGPILFPPNLSISTAMFVNQVCPFIRCNP